MLNNVYIVLPVWNEGKVVKDAIKEITDAGFKNIIAVCDGSSDDSYERLLEIPGIYVLNHPLNSGKGAAIKTGIEAAKKIGAEYVVTMDADGQHDPKDVVEMLKKLEEGYDVVLGSRLMDHTGMPALKVLFNKVGNVLIWLLYGLMVTDSQSGFRAYNRKAVDLIKTKIADRYSYDSEVIREIRHHKLKFLEIPIKVRYTDYSMKKPNKQSFTQGVKMLIKLIMAE